LANPTYWVQIFTFKTWQRFLDHGGTVTGFRVLRWKYIQTIKPGDFVLAYLSGVSKWIAVLEVTSEPYLDMSRIWEEDIFPCRVGVKIVASTDFANAVPIRSLKDRLSIFQAKNWSLYLINSPRKWTASDGAIIVEAVCSAQRAEIVNRAKS
jgi:predicted RNA-binding protein